MDKILSEFTNFNKNDRNCSNNNAMWELSDTKQKLFQKKYIDIFYVFTQIEKLQYPTSPTTSTQPNIGPKQRSGCDSY